MLVMAIADLRMLLKAADITAAMSVEGQLGTDRVFADDLQALRPHPGQGASAANLRRILADSGVVASHRGPDCNRVQDAYSLRCSPQVHGARPRHRRARGDRSRPASSRARSTTRWCSTTAASSPTATSTARRSPTCSTSSRSSAADVASIAERRTDRFLDKARSHGLHPFLADDPGVDSGHMIAQYTQAAIVSEMKRLAAPASVDSIPSSAMQEDHVSMGWSAARKLRRVGRRARPGRRDRVPHRRPRPRHARARCSRPRPPPPRRAAAPQRRGARDPTGTSPPRSSTRGRTSSPAPWSAPSKTPSARSPSRTSYRSSPIDRRTYDVREGEPDDTRSSLAPRTGAVLRLLADRGADADADEQPRPGERRAPRGPGRLRRHRQGGAVLGGVRRDRPHAEDAGGRRDAAGAVAASRSA